MSPPQILVVDDNATNLKLVSEILIFEGYDVLNATDAEAAQVTLAATLPDLILMDIALPGMDGLTLTRLLKADPRTAHIRIVALTAFAMKGDKQKALDAGCDGYITKPIDTRALPLALAEVLSRPSMIRHDTIEQDATGRDAMEREATEREAMEREAMEREAMVREATEREDSLKILVVEDQPSHLKLAYHVLANEGHEVSEAHDAEEALNMIKANRPEMILLDMALPGADGLTLVRRLKADPGTCEIHVVAVTASPEKFPKSAAMAAGCDAYIMKPIDTREISRQLGDIAGVVVRNGGLRGIKP